MLKEEKKKREGREGRGEEKKEIRNPELQRGTLTIRQFILPGSSGPEEIPPAIPDAELGAEVEISTGGSWGSGDAVNLCLKCQRELFRKGHASRLKDGQDVPVMEEGGGDSAKQSGGTKTLENICQVGASSLPPSGSCQFTRVKGKFLKYQPIRLDLIRLFLVPLTFLQPQRPP